MIDRVYAQRLAETILKDVLKPLSFRSADNLNSFNIISDFEEERDRLLGEALSKLWDQLMSNYKAYESGQPLLVSEKALACLIRRGLDRKDLTMSGTKAGVKLSSFNYYVDKQGVGCTAGPSVWSNYLHRLPMRWIALSGEDFADFMFDFDGIVPWVEKRVDDYLLDFKIKAMQYRILCQTADELGEKYLSPAGIEWHVDTGFSETTVPVSFRDKEHEPIHETIPADKLAEAFRDIPQKMERQATIRRHRSIFHHISDDDLMESIFP